MKFKNPILLILTFFLVSCITKFDLNDTTYNFTSSKELKLGNVNTNGEVDYLIITTEIFESILEPLAIWKTQKGIISKIELVSDIDQTYEGMNLPEKIKNCISDYHSNNCTQWVLLAGDHNHIPTKYITCYDGYSNDGDVVCCDSYYGDINNDWTQTNFDYKMELYVGRLTANNKNEMQSLVQRILNYEKNPPIGAWMSHALLAGAILQFDQDWNDDNLLDYAECDANRFNNYINDTILPNGWSSVLLAQNLGIKGSDYQNDFNLDYVHLKDAINQGCSIGNIYVHGRPQSMSIGKWTEDLDGDMLVDYTEDPYLGGVAIDNISWEILFDTSFTDLLQEDKLGLYFLGSCSVGTFDDENDCIAEYFLKNLAIGCVAESYVAWGEDQWYEREHGGWFIEGLGFRFLEQIFKYNQPGKALALAKADYVADRIVSPEKNEYTEWGNKTLKQYNLLGDPECPIWFSVPKQLNVTIDQPFDDIRNTMILKVTADDVPVQNVTITYTENNILIWKGKTNENGTIEIPFSQIKMNNYVFTASNNGYLPFQDNIPQITDSRAIPGFHAIIISFIILSFIGLISIYYTYPQMKREYD